MEEENETSCLRSSRGKNKSPLTCCFTPNHRQSSSFDAASASAPWSPTTWIKFKSKTNDLPEPKSKCRNFISRIGRHRGHSSAEFSYDPLSYALNFEEPAPYDEEQFPINNFTARLAASPPSMRTRFDRESIARSTLDERTEDDQFELEDEEVKSPTGISLNGKILVQLNN